MNTWMKPLAATLCVLLLTSAVLAADAAPPDALILRREAVFDPFAQMDAFTILVPDGWKMQGPVRGYVDGVREASIAAAAPGIGIQKATEIAERFQSEGKDWMFRCQIRRQAASPREYVRLFTVANDRPDIAAAKDVVITAEMNLPELAQATVDEKRAAAPVFKDCQCRASRFRITYTSPEGKAMEEQFVCILLNYPLGEGRGAITGWTASVSSYRAPAGQLDRVLPLMATVETSVMRQLPWFSFNLQMQQAIFQARLDAQRQGMQQMALDNAEHQKRMRNMAREASNDMSDRIRNRFKNEQAAKAESHHQFMNYVRDKQDYVNPRDSSRMTLPAGYRFNYVSNTGAVVSTNDATYHPPVDPKTSWDLMDRSK